MPIRPVARSPLFRALPVPSLTLALLVALAPARLDCQQADSPETAAHAPAADSLVQNNSGAVKTTPEQDLAWEGLVSYGNYRIFASTENCHLYAGGAEYDRHSWGSFIGARMDYVGEIQFLILNQPAVTDIWGDTIGTGREIIPGIGFLPVGLRMVWRDRRAVKPYFIVKGGMNAFSKKPLTPASTYEAFNLQEAIGVLLKATPRYDLRLGLFGDYHFSNGFMVPSNPGLDVMNATVALSYHLGKPRSQ